MPTGDRRSSERGSARLGSRVHRSQAINGRGSPRFRFGTERNGTDPIGPEPEPTNGRKRIGSARIERILRALSVISYLFVGVIDYFPPNTHRPPPPSAVGEPAESESWQIDTSLSGMSIKRLRQLRTESDRLSSVIPLVPRLPSM